MEQITFELTPLTIIDVFSITTAIMLGLLFITRTSDNRKANVFLTLFLWSLSFEVLESFSETIQEIDIPTFNTAMLTIPLLFFYVNTTLNKKWNLYVLWLFLPWLISIFFSVDENEIKYLEYVFNITILIVILNRINKNITTIKDYYSEIENKTLTWLKTIVFIFLGFHLLWIIEDIIGLQFEEITMYFAAISSVLTFFMIYWIGHNGFSQSAMFTSLLFKKEELEVQNKVEDTTAKFKKILANIEKEKYYTIASLNIKQLADLLEIREKELSRLINKHTQNNFYQFINKYRIEEFKELLLSPKAKQLSILGLAQEAGFASKSTFYAAFKSIEGITPKQYQNSLKKSE